MLMNPVQEKKNRPSYYQAITYLVLAGNGKSYHQKRLTVD
jgi:hypothetical protein